MSNETNLNPVFASHEVGANPPAATTTQNYTTTSCSCYVSGHNVVVNVCTDLGGTIVARIPVPSVTINGCNGATLQGFKITVLPTRGTLSLNGVNVTLNQIISKTDFVNLVYTLGANQTKATDTATYQIWATCGNSGNLTISFNIDGCYTSGATTTTIQ